MPKILGIETTGNICSVALFNKNEVLGTRENTKSNEHSAILHILILELLKDHQIQARDLDAIALSAGPGSYTGLRIGASSAKGLCLATKSKLISVPTHYAMLYSEEVMQNNLEFERTICLTDARRNDAFGSIYSSHKKQVGKTEVWDFTEQDIQKEINSIPSLIIGSGAEKAKLHLSEKHHFISSPLLHAKHLFAPSNWHYENRNFESVNHFGPLYEKEFYTTQKISS